MKLHAIALSGAGRGLQWGGGRGGEDSGGNLTNVQCKAIQNCHNESPLYNEYILIKIGKNDSQFTNLNFSFKKLKIKT
jgi:hypothetical protein